MDLTSPELVTATHALNTMSQEQQINIVAHLSETISTDELITLSQSEHKISIPSAPGPTLESKPISTDDLNTLSPNPCTPGPTPESEPNSVDELNTLSQEHEINILDIPDLSEKDSIDDDLRHSENEIESDGAGTNAQSRAGSTVPSSSHRLACRDLIDGSTAEYMEICVPLHEAAITGNWKAAKVIFDERPELVGFSITAYGDTPLHIAVSAEPTPETENFTENLVSRMEMTDLEIENDASDYAFNVVVVKGSVKMLEVMLNKHITLLDISPLTTWNGLGATTRYGNHDMAWYFYNIPEAKMLGWSWKDRQRCSFFIQCLNGDMLDVALKVVLTGNLKISESINTWTASLEILARRPDAFSRTEIGSIWRITQSFLAFFHLRKGYPDMDNYALKLLKIIVKSFPGYNTPDEILSIYPIPYTNVEIPYQVESPDQVKRKTTSQLIVLAAEEGNTRFVIELLKTFPYLVWATNDDNQSIFHIAVMHRHIGIYNLLYEIGAKKDIIMANVTDEMENSILHLVGNTSKDTQFLTVSEASLLMQRELLWFKEVEKMIAPQLRIRKNKDGQTPYQLFSENNKELVSKGLKWTRDCMVVSALIITIAFAAALTVPGGFNQDTGIPILTREPSFIIFIIADALSLFSSSTSLLVFLSITTTPYGQRDFLYSLPKKLMIGILTLFISVVAMMVTFAASFFVLYRNTYKWLPIIISIFAATPVVVYGSLQYPLLMDMFRSMYDSRYLFKPKRRVLYNVGEKL